MQIPKPKDTTLQALIRRAQRAKGAEAKQIRAEYAELRKIANKRIQRAQKQGDLLDLDLFPTTKSLLDNGNITTDLLKAYNQVVKFLNEKRSTAQGRKSIRQKRVQAFQNLGVSNVNEQNERLFREFMELWRVKYEIKTSQGRRLLRDSDEALEIFDAISEKFTSSTNRSWIMRRFQQYESIHRDLDNGVSLINSKEDAEKLLSKIAAKYPSSDYAWIKSLFNDYLRNHRKGKFII